jgi:hypothetical protein
VSKLLTAQQEFSFCLVNFLDQFYEMHPDVEITFGDFYATTGHMVESCHYSRLAADINFFYKGRYLRTYDDAPGIWDSAGALWKSQHSLARWGGDFKSRDLNHFSFEWDGKQ